MKNFIILFLLFVCTFLGRGQEPSLEIELHDGAYYDVFSTKDGQKVQVTRFGPWEEIRDLKVSPDLRYFFFRHKEKNGRVYKLTLYQINPLKKLMETTPGYGGLFGWNSLNQIIHNWGCGTNCSNFVIYDLGLKEIFFTLSTGGIILNENKDILVQLSTTTNQIFIYDLRTLTPGKVQGYSDTLSKNFDLQTLVFISGYRFKIESKSGLEQKQLILDCNNLQLSVLDPADTKQFYMRQD